MAGNEVPRVVDTIYATHEAWHGSAQDVSFRRFGESFAVSGLPELGPTSLTRSTNPRRSHLFARLLP